MQSFSKVVIIYNPNSTGDSPAMAHEFYQQVKEKLPGIPVVLQETNHAGHAEELSYKAAKSKPNTVIVSVSGDGGYNEVVNGAMKALDEGKSSPICAILPGGNANDHYSNTARRPLIEALMEESVEQLDLLRLKFADTTRYAHSYIGLGLTPLVAAKLNRHSLTVLKEAWLALKAYWGLRPLEIITDSKKIQFDSILITTVESMAKHLTIAKDNDPRDGMFELLIWKHGNKLRLTFTLIKAILGLKIPHKKVTEFAFTTRKAMPVQLDGEIVKLPKNTLITIAAQKHKLRTIF
jgi:diacylglycerol kinase (ATP)